MRTEEENTAIGCLIICIVGALTLFAGVVFIVAAAVKWVMS